MRYGLRSHEPVLNMEQAVVYRFLCASILPRKAKHRHAALEVGDDAPLLLRAPRATRFHRVLPPLLPLGRLLVRHLAVSVLANEVLVRRPGLQELLECRLLHLSLPLL